MILTTLILMQGQVLAPAETGEEGRSILPELNLANTDLTLIGRMQQDFASIDDDNFNSRDAAELRRARLGVTGTLAEGLSFKMEANVAGGDDRGGFTDVYLKFSNLPVGTVKVGHMKEPFSLSWLTSSRFITFAERAETLDRGRNTGVMLSDSNENLTWQVGTFWETDSDGDSNGWGSDASLTGRVVYRPYMENGGERLAHIGLGLSLREEEDGVLSASDKGGVHLLAMPLASGAIATSDGSTLIGIEAAIQEGPIHGQFEYVMADGDDNSLSAWYLQGGYFLTGESRGYKTGSGAWDRVKPSTPYGQNGNGAWEVAGRLGAVDFSEGGSADAELTSITVALNWYLTNHTRIGFNLISADSDEVADAVTAAVIRFGIDW